MSRLWLPIHEPTTGREMTLYIPGADHMDIGQLKAIVEAEKEKTLAQLKAKGPKPVSRMSRDDVKGALREFVAWRNERRENLGHRRIFT